MSKIYIFIALTLLAIVFGLLAIKNDATFENTFWSQLFWLSAGTVATTFLVQTVLQRDLSVRQRKEDRFAFRSFSATIFRFLCQITGCEAGLLSQITLSALEGDKQFAEIMKQTTIIITDADTIKSELYHSYYLDIASHIRDIANRFIRLYSKNQKEMIEHYQNLQDLAQRWNYKDILSKDSQDYTNSLDMNDRNRKKRETYFSEEIAEVKTLLKETAAYLSVLAERTATEKGMPSLS